MSGFTLIVPEAINSIARGYSPGRSAGALQADLTRNDFLQRQIYVGGDVANEDDSSAFAGGVDGGGDGFSAADTFKRNVYALIGGELQNLRKQIFAGEERFCGTELFGEF